MSPSLPGIDKSKSSAAQVSGRAVEAASAAQDALLRKSRLESIRPPFAVFSASERFEATFSTAGILAQIGHRQFSRATRQASGFRSPGARRHSATRHGLGFASRSVDDHGEHAAGFSLLLGFRTLGRFGRGRTSPGYQIGQAGVFEDTSGGVAHLEKDLVKRAVSSVRVDEHTQLLGIAE